MDRFWIWCNVYAVQENFRRTFFGDLGFSTKSDFEDGALSEFVNGSEKRTRGIFSLDTGNFRMVPGLFGSDR